jgi:hypothetical protein
VDIFFFSLFMIGWRGGMTSPPVLKYSAVVDSHFDKLTYACVTGAGTIYLLSSQTFP